MEIVHVFVFQALHPISTLTHSGINFSGEKPPPPPPPLSFSEGARTP